MSATSPISLREFYPYRLAVLSNTVSGTLSKTYAHYNLSIPQWRVIAVLAEHPDFTASQIAEYTAMDKATISRAVRTLMEAGHIKRKASQKDGRASHLQMTAKGKKMYASVIPKLLEQEKQILSALSAKEIKTLDTTIHKLHQQCEAL
jgi:DNA-binding MarR family transcriptional regulator